MGIKTSPRRQPSVEGGRVKLSLRDIAGGDALASAVEKYLRRAAARLLLADGTGRPAGDARPRKRSASLPRLPEIDKRDPAGNWAIGDTEPAARNSPGGLLLRRSERGGENVEAAFARLAQMLTEHQT